MSKQTGLARFRQTNFSGAPWFAKAEPGLVVECLIDLSSVEVITSDTPWGDQTEADAMMKGPAKGGDLLDEDGDQVAEKGKHRIPFWACEGLQSVLKEYEDDGGDMDGWIKLAYKRTVSRGKNRDGEKVDINEAHWAIVE